MSDLDLMTIEQMAARLHRSADFVTKEARKGTIPSRKIGKLRFFTEQDLADYLERCRQGTDPFARSPRSQARVGRTTGRRSA